MTTPATTPETRAGRPTAAASSPRARRRANWFAARARNAARHFTFVAVVGGVAVVTTLLVLVLIPREVDRAVQAEIEALPAPRDTSALLMLARGRRDALTRVETALRDAQAADSVVVAALARAATAAQRAADSIIDDGRTAVAGVAPPPPRERAPDVSRDAETADLVQRLDRARVSPLLESYRELALAALMRGDVRVRAIVDSLGQVDREREAFAALGGPDARYAALTARMNELGQRLMRIAESRIDRESANVTTAPTGSESTATPAFTLPRRNPRFLQELTTQAAGARQDLQRAERALVEAREWNTALDRRRQAARARANLRIPPMAMLASALVLGLVVGYSGSVARELRTPRIADRPEAERITGVRVITYTGMSPEQRATRSRRRADRALPPALDATSEGFHLLHLALTGVGDVTRRVRLLSDSPQLAAVVAANLAANAARDARAVLLVDLDLRHRLVGPTVRATEARGITDVLLGDAELFEAIREVPVGRDVYMSVLHGGRRTTRPTPERRMVVYEDLARLVARYDLTVIVGDETSPDGDALLPADDVILCARVGATPLAWLSRATRRALANEQRIRAVLLWAADAPVT